MALAYPLLPTYAMFKVMDTMCLKFVPVIEGRSAKKKDSYNSHCVLHLTPPLRTGGMGLHQIFCAHRRRFAMLMHTTLRVKPHMLPHNFERALPAKVVPIRNYM